MNIYHAKTALIRTLLACCVVVLIAGPAFAELTDEQFQKMMAKYLEKEENLDALGKAVQRSFQKLRQQQAKDRANLEKKQLEEQFDNPIKIDTAGAPILGKPDAKITVVEFSDFQCPFCKRGNDTMKDLLKEFPDDVKLIFMHLPLPFHKQATSAAVASIAAGEQGKFWEMHDLLFDNQGRLGEEDKLYVELAEKLKLDVAKFKEDLKAEKNKKVVEANAAVATKLGVNGTPGFFVNGVQVRGARPLPYFKDLVTRWKEKLG